MASRKALDSPESYTVGWIAALSIERAAAVAMLDEKHTEPNDFVRHQSDTNAYTWGRIGEHNIAIASLPAGLYGTTSAGTTASNLLASLPSIRIGLLVGIGGGIAQPDEKRDIRLGDVVVSQPDGTTGGVCQYDLVKAKSGNNRERKGFLGMPPTVLLNALGSIQAEHEQVDSIIPDLLQKMLEDNPKMARRSKQSTGYVHQEFDNDRLFKASYEHISGPDCSSCDVVEEIQRDPRDTTDPEIHYGIIASGNTLVKDAAARDRIVSDVGENCICFEMEAAGLMNHFPCIVIRGICDYADSHKNDDWQRYASATAAAYAKEFLTYVPAADVQKTEKAKDLLQFIQKDLVQIRQEGNKVRKIVETQESKNHLARIERWLSPPDTSSNINKARKLRHEGTGTWFLTSSVFEDWKAERRRYLWLNGLAGCGKTVLSVTILENLEQLDTHTALTFFFDFSDSKKQTLDSLLRALAFQLYLSGGEAARRLDHLFTSNDDGRKQPDITTMSTCVESMIRTHEKAAVVLDAIDECTERSELLQWMESFASSSNARLIVTGRPEPDFQRKIPRYFGEENCVLLDKQAIDADIRSYVMAQLVQLPDFVDNNLSEDLIVQIRNKVGDGADGMFRWARCQLDTLAKCRSPKDIETALGSLPRDLDETYKRMVESIPVEIERDAIRLLQFLVYTERPLTLPEAREIIATKIDETQRGFDINDRPFETKILDYCASLVAIEQVTSWGWGVQESQIVQQLHLAHFSVKEYLLRQSQFSDASANFAITMTCLTYLTGITGSDAQIHQDYPMARYAAEAWMDYAALVETSTDIVRAAVDFLQNETTFQRWGRLYQPDEEWNYNPGPPTACSLYYACLKGLIATAKVLLLAEGADVNAQGDGINPGTAIHAASIGGHKEIVQLLLAEGADVNAQGSDGLFNSATALHAASRGGHKEIVQLLLAKGADVNVQGSDDLYDTGTPLHAASLGGHKKIVQLLLAEGADVNAHGSDGFYGTGTPLYAASIGGHKDIVQLLLAEGAEVNAQGSDRFYNSVTALHTASRRGHKEIVHLLLAEGAEVNVQGSDGLYSTGTALHAASLGGHKEIVQLLLAEGADYSAPRRLLAKGVDVNAQSSHDLHAL